MTEDARGKVLDDEPQDDDTDDAPPSGPCHYCARPGRVCVWCSDDVIVTDPTPYDHGPCPFCPCFVCSKDNPWDEDTEEDEIEILTAVHTDIASKARLLRLGNPSMPELSPEPPIHPNVTLDELESAQYLLHTIILGLGHGDRMSLKQLVYAHKSILRRNGEIPVPTIPADGQRFFLKNFAETIVLYHSTPGKPTENVLHSERLVLLSVELSGKDCDPAFANLDHAFLKQCIDAITWGKPGSNACGWIRAAARIAVSVSAFGSAEMGNNDKERENVLENQLGKLWSTRDTKRFHEPKDFEEWKKAKRVTTTIYQRLRDGNDY